jgi:hypothetical protein
MIHRLDGLASSRASRLPQVLKVDKMPASNLDPCGSGLASEGDLPYKAILTLAFS